MNSTATFLPSAQIQQAVLEHKAAQARAAQEGRVLLSHVVLKQSPGSTFWPKLSDADFKFAEAVKTAALTLPGEQCDVKDADGTIYRVMAS